MNDQLILKVNIAGKGYTYHGLNESDVTPRDMDEVLPQPGYFRPDSAQPRATEGWEYPPRPCVAYTISRLRSGHVVYAAGGFWPHYHDEYGREGLFAWLALVNSDASPECAINHGRTLSGVVQQFEEKYEAIGSLLGRVATESSSQTQVLTALANLGGTNATGRPGQDDAPLIAACVAEAPRTANLQVPLPLSPLFAIPCLAYLASTRSDAERVGGGSLLPGNARAMTLVSLDEDIPGRPTFMINPQPLLAVGPAFSAVDPTDRVHAKSRNEEDSKRRTLWERVFEHIPPLLPVRHGFLHSLQIALLIPTFLFLYFDNTQVTSAVPPQGSTPHVDTLAIDSTVRFSPILFRRNVIDPLIVEIKRLKPDGLADEQLIRSSLLWQLKSQAGVAVFLRADSSFSVTLTPHGQQVASTWTHTVSTVPEMLAEVEGVPSLIQVNTRLNIYGRANLNSEQYIFRELDAVLQIAEQ